MNLRVNYGCGGGGGEGAKEAANDEDEVKEGEVHRSLGKRRHELKRLGLSSQHIQVFLLSKKYIEILIDWKIVFIFLDEFSTRYDFFLGEEISILQVIFADGF